MLSCMETQLGLMVIGPKGQSLRLQRNNPAFQSGRDILRQTLPAEQAWAKLQELVANPLKALVNWCERFGLVFKEDGDFITLNDQKLSRETWLPLLTRTQAVGGTPMHLLAFAAKLGESAVKANVASLTLHLQEDKLRGLQPAALLMLNLPKEAKTGDLVTETSKGSTPFLVSAHDCLVSETGTVSLHRGVVLSQVRDAAEVADILEQPAVLGFNRTYRCEEGTSDGWLEDLSFDSLTAARRNAKEIQDSGSEARIINRITGEAVALL